MPRRLEMRRDPCTVCNLPVFLAEKLVISRRTYHRTCFRCARCTNLLTPGNYYETEDGDYCCETCPDEDKSISIQSSPSTTPFSTPSKPSTPQPTPRSLSDEEKTKQLLQTSRVAKMRLNFMADHLESSSTDTTGINEFKEVSISSQNLQTSPINEQVEEQQEEISSPELNVIKKLTDYLSEDSCLSGNNDSVVCQDTKETLGVVNNDDEDSQCLSLVASRLKIFENSENGKNMKKIEQIPDKQDSVDVHDSRLEEPESVATLESSRDTEEPEKIDEPQEDTIQAPAGEIGVLEAQGVDLSNEEYPEDMNPFKSDDDDDDDQDENNQKLPQEVKKVSTNPFGSSEDDDDEEEEEKIPTPAARKRLGGGEPVKRILQAPQINLNPFWSDDEDGESDEETASNTPIPKPRTIKQTPDTSIKNLERSGLYASSSSLASSSSTTTTPGGTYRKRKPAPPPPPIPNERVTTGQADFKTPQASHDSPIRTTPRHRKLKPAPPPPLPTSLLANLTLESPHISWEDEKISKNQSNKSKQSRSPEENDFPYQDKSTQGKWKRKKGPAPARPIPQRRKIKVMSMKDVKMELDEIEVQQQGLEKQGVRLEQLIRDRCENPDRNDGDQNITMDAEELVLELFALVNEKNELFRRQAELMLLKRQQRLEEEHADIEYQIRCLMLQPEATKTDFDKQREEALIQRLVEIVERRSEIVECLEMDRKREVEEDKSINHHMGLFAAKSKMDLNKDEGETSQKSHKSKKLKIKGISLDKHLRKIHKKDADKDVDETEVKLKRQNKKKWF